MITQCVGVISVMCGGNSCDYAVSRGDLSDVRRL